jgi:hypothetical protein
MKRREMEILTTACELKIQSLEEIANDDLLIYQMLGELEGDGYDCEKMEVSNKILQEISVYAAFMDTFDLTRLSVTHTKSLIFVIKNHVPVKKKKKAAVLLKLQQWSKLPSLVLN